MRFIARRLWLTGTLFVYSSILLLPFVTIGAQWYVTKNLAEPLNFGMIEWDLCTDILSIATLGELAATGFVLLWLAAIFRVFDWLKVRISN